MSIYSASKVNDATEELVFSLPKKVKLTNKRSQWTSAEDLKLRKGFEEYKFIKNKWTIIQVVIFS